MQGERRRRKTSAQIPAPGPTDRSGGTRQSRSNVSFKLACVFCHCAETVRFSAVDASVSVLSIRAHEEQRNIAPSPLQETLCKNSLHAETKRSCNVRSRHSWRLFDEPPSGDMDTQ
eukprot:757780-Hanusia_phi.AAC.2